MKKPILVVPKGRLYKSIKRLFELKGIDMPCEDTRQYYFPDWSEDCALFIAKPKAIPELMHSKFAEFGICGFDIMSNSEYSKDVELLKHTGLNKVKVCLCSKMSMDELTHLKRPVIVATEFDIIASHYFTKLGVPHYILNTAGSTEGYIDIGADCIIDVVETGETLRANGINIVDVITKTDTCIYEHSSLCDCWLPSNIHIVF